MTKRLATLLLAILPLFTFSSCEKDKVLQSGYVYTFTQFSSSNTENDLELVEKFFTEKNMSTTVAYFLEGESYDANDAQMVAYFEANIEDITDVDIEELGVSADTQFTFILCKAFVEPDEGGKLGSFVYPSGK